MLQVKTKKDRVIENDKHDEYKKIARHKQKRHRCATYNFDYQTIKSILNHDITRAREEREKRQKCELIEFSNEEFS